MRIVALLTLATLAFAAYPDEVQKWRAEREARLKAPDGWLTLVGLAWLKEGANTVGSGGDSRVQLPEGLPKTAGSFHLKGKTVTFEPAAGVQATVNGSAKAAGKIPLQADTSGKPDILSIGRVRLHIIERGGRLGVRIKDDESAARKQFRGLRWFPVRQDWAVRARFIPEPRTMYFDAQAGGKQRMTSPGRVEWTRNGRTLRLTPVDEDGKLFFVFRDVTAGKTTYPAARFLYAEPAKDGTVLLDFNKAYNPPCVFTPYATCPLPPPENRLKVRVEAGEMMYEGPGAHR